MQVLPFFPLILLFVIFGGCVEPDEGNSYSKQIYEKVDLNKLESCSLESPCESILDSCISYGGSTARCYRSGREHEVVGCTGGSLIIEMSEPGQAACI